MPKPPAQSVGSQSVGAQPVGSTSARHSGVILHPTSLPGPFGIGDLGPAARGWIDFLAESGCDIWQVLPLGPTGYGDSPYQTFSSFAGNPYLLSPEELVADRLLKAIPTTRFPAGRVDFGRVITWKLELIEQAWESFGRKPSNSRLVKDFAAFKRRESRWLGDYTLFRAIKEESGGRPWPDWPAPLRSRDPVAMRSARRRLGDQINRHAFAQFLFFRQWGALRDYANRRGIKILGDVPIFTAHDSADVWARPELFRIKANGQPTVVAGVPPDYYAEDGQLWGNPLYRWGVHEKDDFSWWVDRLQSTLKMVDIIRLDHFRGFYDYWEIPAGAETARNGRWVKAPGAKLLTVLQRRMGDVPFVAEDLGGDMPPGVSQLRDQFDLPGMVVLQFAFGSGPGHEFLPHNFTSTNWAVYTSTHDNTTAEGYWDEMGGAERRFAVDYLSGTGETYASQLTRLAWSSTGRFAMTTVQDLLELGPEAKMNTPGTSGGNWQWRMNRPMSGKVTKRLYKLNQTYRRGLLS